MKTQQAKTLLKRLRYWADISDKHQQALYDFIDTVAPKSYSPIIEPSPVKAFIDGVEFHNKDLAEWLGYICFEASLMDIATVIDEDGTEYNFCKDKDIIKFLVKNY